MKLLALLSFFVLLTQTASAEEVVRVTFQGKAAQELAIAAEISESLNLNCTRQLKNTEPPVSECFFEAVNLEVGAKHGEVSTIRFSGDAADEIAEIAKNSGSQNLPCQLHSSGHATCTLQVVNLVVTGLDGELRPSIIIRN